MDFPVWQLGAFGGGFWIILIAVLYFMPNGIFGENINDTRV